MKLSKLMISGAEKPVADGLKEAMELPEKVLQFGTGVLLRGLPDYFIDKANKQGLFNGRILVVKSTDSGGTDAFAEQDGLFTQCIRGIQNGMKMEEDIINCSISRVLSAKTEWDEILNAASNPHMQVVISNTTEVGITLVKDDIHAAPPVSFPGKLLAFLYKRYSVFNGDVDKGMVILPTELIPDNGNKLKEIVFELAAQNNLPVPFIAWLQNANHFCNTLVDRIVPGKLSDADKQVVENKMGYTDDLMITSESYSLWAIESSEQLVVDALSFVRAGEGVVIAPDINKFRELKLRLLNGTHTFTSGLAHIAGIHTVKEAMDNEAVSGYIENLMLEEIAPMIVTKNLSEEEAAKFSQQVMDRFRNPHIEHKWLSICVQYSSKIKMRTLPVLTKYFNNNDDIPVLMTLGIAAHLLFMNCTQKGDGKFYGKINGAEYLVQDDNAAWFAAKWENGYHASLVKEILSDSNFWGYNLDQLPGFTTAVNENLISLMNGEVFKLLKEYQSEKLRV